MLLAAWEHCLHGIRVTPVLARAFLPRTVSLSSLPPMASYHRPSTIDYQPSSGLFPGVLLTCSRSFFKSWGLSRSKLPLPPLSSLPQAYGAGHHCVISAFPTCHIALLKMSVYVNGHNEYADASLILQKRCSRDQAPATHWKLQKIFPSARPLSPSRLTPESLRYLGSKSTSLKHPWTACFSVVM